MLCVVSYIFFFFFFQAEDGIRDVAVTGVQTCALPISTPSCAGWAGRVSHRRCSRPASRIFRCPCSTAPIRARSEERRVGEEGRSRWAPDHLKKKKKKLIEIERVNNKKIEQVDRYTSLH